MHPEHLDDILHLDGFLISYFTPSTNVGHAIKDGWVKTHRRPRTNLSLAGMLSRPPASVETLLVPVPSISRLLEVDHARQRRLKPTRTVEAFQMRLIIDVEPLHAALSGHHYGLKHQLASNTTASPVRMHGGIKQKSVTTAIPSEVDKSDEVVVGIATDIGQTALQDRLKIAPRMVGPRHGKERIQVVITDRWLNVIRDVVRARLHLWYQRFARDYSRGR